MLRFILSFALVLLFSLPHAHAAIALRANASVQNSGTGIIFDQKSDSDDTGLQSFSGNQITPGMSVQTEQLIVSSRQDSPTVHNSALSESWSQAEVGAFHAYLHGTVHTDAGAVAANSSTYGEWNDNVRILSDTLPNGTPVQLTATIVVDRLIDVSPGESWYISVYSPYVRFDDSSSQRNLSNTAAGVINTFVGSTLGLWQTINANLQPQVIDPGSAHGTLDIRHTSHFYLDAGNQDVTFDSEGKYSYTPIPEPSSIVLLALAAPTLLLLRRRRTLN